MKSTLNRTITLEPGEIPSLRSKLLPVSSLNSNFLNRTILGDCFAAFERLPESCTDLLILDPPYNMSKTFGSERFSRMSVSDYTVWMRKLLMSLIHTLKRTSTVYVCGDWISSTSIHEAASDLLKIRNRITWAREKGRGAQRNWKNSSEDIWFCTVSDDFVFNLDAVKLRRKVIAPYRAADGSPKDWDAAGGYRDTCPSNLWTDITVPFWSMPENTEHPTQKPEKLIAKLVLASSNPGDVVLDPFAGSGTTGCVAKKLGRNYIQIEADEHYAMLSEKRLQIADTDKRIQGYSDGIFWDRNAQRA